MNGEKFFLLIFKGLHDMAVGELELAKKGIVIAMKNGLWNYKRSRPLLKVNRKRVEEEEDQ